MRRLAYSYHRFSERVDRDVNARVHAVVRTLLARGEPGLLDVIPGYNTLLVEFDPSRTTPSRLRLRVERLFEEAPGPAVGGREVTVPVVYDGPDLQDVAGRAGLATEDVIGLHSGAEYHVYAVGFTPGFPFMGDVDPRIRAPRLDEPRRSVPAGSVGIADGQTGVYPLTSPGGWRLLGRATENVYDPQRERPFLLEPGDRVRFVPTAGATMPAPPEPVDLLPEEPHLPAFLVREPGLLDLVLDEGRFRAGRFGLARSGPLDAVSAAIANGLVGNPRGAPLLEMSVLGPTLEVLRDVVVAFAGQGVAPTVNGSPLEPYRSVLVRAGAVLRFPPARAGRTGYLAAAGGFEARRFLGSASVDARGLIGRPLRAGDVLGLAAVASPRPGFAFVPYWPDRSEVVVRLVPGPQYEPELFAALTARPLRIEHADRMGVRLSQVDAAGSGIASEGNPLGAVQLTSDGHPLVLLNDRGTMGGYTKPAIVDARDLPMLAQARDGAWLRFVPA
jgi:KipI family sensor histidine kinase inhibitor